ncbi:hypothetical protein O3P69_000198 [Scylla paramamosain]|uniref:Uncharacterized protein n=1 Tax=Scylla paramamosain TaxID=85552 RepID=A0AAW0UWR5_SCYPA
MVVAVVEVGERGGGDSCTCRLIDSRSVPSPGPHLPPLQRGSANTRRMKQRIKIPLTVGCLAGPSLPVHSLPRQCHLRHCDTLICALPFLPSRLALLSYMRSRIFFVFPAVG